LETGAYDPEEINLILSQLNDRRALKGDGLVAVDCGANIGVMTLEMGRHLQGWGSVIAFEAQEWLFYALCGNVALANAFNVQVRHAAVTQAPCVLSVPSLDYTKPASLGSFELNWWENVEFIGQSISYDRRNLKPLNAVSIDSLVLPRLDFLKVDVEGMELDVLKGAELTIEQYKPTLWVEWIKSDKAALLDFMGRFGYQTYEHGMNLLALTNGD
jgi:FkbM family methyltransferase